VFGNIFKDKKILITGHTGFKGSWLTLWLSELGAKICGYSNRVLPDPSHFTLLKISTCIRHEIGDICDKDKLDKVVTDFKPDIIFHLAAQPLVLEALKNPLSTVQTNTLGTVTLLDVVRRHPDINAVIIVTSDKVYHNQEWAWGYRETDRLGGKDPYSASKAATELILQSFLNCFFPFGSAHTTRTIVSVGRAGNVIGGGDWAENRIVPDCMKAWGLGGSVSIRNPMSTRPWQHVLEPLSGYLRLAELAVNGHFRIHREAYNFGPTQETNRSVLDLLTSMANRWPQAKWEVEKTSSQSNKPEAGLLKLSCEKANRDLDWHPAWSYQETVNQTVDWYRASCHDQSFDALNYGLKQIEMYSAVANNQRLSEKKNA